MAVQEIARPNTWPLPPSTRTVAARLTAYRARVATFGDEAPPDGPILAVRVEDLGEK